MKNQEEWNKFVNFTYTLFKSNERTFITLVLIQMRQCSFRTSFNFSTSHSIICSGQWLFTSWLSKIFASERWWTTLENSNPKGSFHTSQVAPSFLLFYTTEFRPLAYNCQVLCRTSWVMALKLVISRPCIICIFPIWTNWKNAQKLWGFRFTAILLVSELVWIIFYPTQA